MAAIPNKRAVSQAILSLRRALKQTIKSIETHIFTLPDSTVVLPGHGEFTIVGESRREHAVFASRPLDPGLSGDVTWA